MAYGDAQETYRLLPGELCGKAADNGHDFLVEVNGSFRCPAPGMEPEIRCPDLECHRAAAQSAGTQTPAHFLCQVPERCQACISAKEIFRIRLFPAQGLPFFVRNHGTVVQTLRKAQQRFGIPARQRTQERGRTGSQLADCCDAQTVQGRCCLLADAKDTPDRKGCDPGFGRFRTDDGEAVRFFHVTGQLGQEFIGRQSYGSGEPCGFPDGGFDLWPQGNDPARESFHTGHIEKGFIDGNRFHTGRKLVEDVPDPV